MSLFFREFRLHPSWKPQDVQAVHDAAEMVRSQDRAIVLAPREIDGSFLFHFQAADGLIYDSFCPLDALRRQVAGL